MPYDAALVRFNTGEVSDLLGARIDTQEYRGACKTLTNFIPLVQGPVSRRGGTRFLKEAKYHDKKARLFSFQFSISQAYLLEFGENYVRFFYNRQSIVDEENNPIEIETPYLEDDLDSLYFAQSGDVLYISHPLYPLRTIIRYDLTDWRTQEVNLVDGPYLPLNTTDISLTPSGTTGTVILTASEDLFCETDVGRAVRIMHPSNPDVQWGAAEITEFLSATSVMAEVLSDFPFLSATESKHWRLGVFSGTTGYASVCTFFEQRLILGKANGVYASKTGQYDRFSPTDTDASVSSEYGYGYELSSDQINDVSWLSSGRVLAIGTVGADFTLTTSGGEGSIDMSVQAQRHSTYGSEMVAPVKVGGATLFVQHYGRKLRSFFYDSSTEGYVAKDLTLLAPHITQSGIREMSFQKEPNSIVWCALKNGKLIGFTYEPEESVQAWHSHEISGASVESIAVVPYENGLYEELYLLVKRTINNEEKYYIEVMEKGIDEEAQDSKECFFLDSGLSYCGDPVQIVGGLSHLEGQTVSILADGAVQTDKVVENAQISLDYPASVIHVGLNFSSILKTMPLSAIGGSVSEASKKRISTLFVRLYKTIGFLIGQADLLERQIFRQADDVMGCAPELFSGDKKVAFNAKWDMVAEISIQQDQPLPFTLLGMFPVVSTHKI